MLGTILSVVGLASDAVNLYKFGSTLAKGQDTEPVLRALERLHAEVERLNDHILYAPGVEGLSDTSESTHRLGDLREVRELLEPMQAALGTDIVSSGLIETPDKMERAMIENPWAVLEDIRPQQLAVPPANPDKIPVLFEYNGERFIGWQMRGVLPMLFNCELHDLPGLGSDLAPQTFQRDSTSSAPSVQSGANRSKLTKNERHSDKNIGSKIHESRQLSESYINAELSKEKYSNNQESWLHSNFDYEKIRYSAKLTIILIIIIFLIGLADLYITKQL